MWLQSCIVTTWELEVRAVCSKPPGASHRRCAEVPLESSQPVRDAVGQGAPHRCQVEASILILCLDAVTQCLVLTHSSGGHSLSSWEGMAAGA